MKPFFTPDELEEIRRADREMFRTKAKPSHLSDEERRERKKAYMREYYQNNKSRYQAYRKRMYAENRERILADEKRKRAEDPDTIRARQRAYYHRNRERRCEYDREYKKKKRRKGYKSMVEHMAKETLFPRLMEAIKAAGYGVVEFADMAKLGYRPFHRRMIGEIMWKLDEMENVCDLLGGATLELFERRQNDE